MNQIHELTATVAAFGRRIEELSSGIEELCGRIDSPRAPWVEAEGRTARICYSVDEAASQLSISTRTLRRMIRDGKLATAHLGQRVLVPHSSLEALVAANLDTTGATVRQAPSHIRAKVAAARARGR